MSRATREPFVTGAAEVLDNGHVLPDYEVRSALCEASIKGGVTLNAQPAIITRPSAKFATVRITDGAMVGLSTEYAWETAIHIVADCGGKFKS